MAKPPATWKKDERDIAEKLTEVLGTDVEYNHVCTRIPLSGSNNRRTDGSDHHGDVSLPDEYDLHVELKRRHLFMHQKLLEDAIKDAAKHGVTNTLLITKTLRQRGFTVVLESDLFFKMLSIPGVRELLKRNDNNPVNAAKSRAASRSVKDRNGQGSEQEDQNISGNIPEDQGS